MATTAPILRELDREWSDLAKSPRARRALIRWSNSHRQLAKFQDLDELLIARRNTANSPEVLGALAKLAPNDDLAARALLQAMVPGIVRLSLVIGYDDEAAIDELVSLTWERIRTYPSERRGSVPGNILLDVRKRYHLHRELHAPSARPLSKNEPDRAMSPEDQVMGRLLIQQLDQAQRSGMMPQPVLSSILRTRLMGEPLADVAADQQVPPAVLCHRRWRAEVRLRELPLAG